MGATGAQLSTISDVGEAVGQSIWHCAVRLPDGGIPAYPHRRRAVAGTNAATATVSSAKMSAAICVPLMDLVSWSWPCALHALACD
jgi:hypothetical protein